VYLDASLYVTLAVQSEQQNVFRSLKVDEAAKDDASVQDRLGV
jgi:hypothetical protein